MGYAAIELFYDPMQRQTFVDRCAADLYLLGSLVFFHFGGTSAKSSLLAAKSQMPGDITNNFEDDLPIWKQAFAHSLSELDDTLRSSGLHDEITAKLIQIVSELCEPDPLRRGNPRRYTANSNIRLYPLRYESKFVHLERLLWVHSK
jgi:eukaryotic-like serine/threonine-protein kinase